MRPVTAWLWTDRSAAARLARLALLPASLVFRSLAAARSGAYRAGLLPAAALLLPTVAVGNLTVGGAGKTPIAAWIAGWYARHGVRPGILLRGYGGDEGAVHRELTPDAVVVENPDRQAGAQSAARQGAGVLVLDDAYQRLDVTPDLNIAVVSAESGRAVPWTLPAGPWREGWRALGRADLVIVTRKRASARAAASMAARAGQTASHATVCRAWLRLSGFRALESRRPWPQDALRGATIVLAAGVADPTSVARQCRALGARVRDVGWRDHQRVSGRLLRHLLQAAAAADYVVVTEKDAGKLRGRWPAGRPEPLVASLEVEWETGLDALTTALGWAVSGGRGPRAQVTFTLGGGPSRATR